MLFKLDLNSNLAVTPGYFNPALNNSALVFRSHGKSQKFAISCRLEFPTIKFQIFYVV